MGKPLLGLEPRTALATIRMGFRQESGNLQSVIIGINKSGKSGKSVVLFLASVFCLRQTQVFTSEPLFFLYFYLFFYIFSSAPTAQPLIRNSRRFTNVLD